MDQIFLGLIASACDGAAHAVVVTAPDLGPGGPRIVYVNPAFEAMAGYGRDEVIGRTPRMFQGKRTSRNALRVFRETLAAGREARMSVLNYKKDGAPYWCDIAAWPVRGLDGRVLCYMAYERRFDKKPGRPRKNRLQENWWHTASPAH